METWKAIKNDGQMITFEIHSETNETIRSFDKKMLELLFYLGGYTTQNFTSALWLAPIPWYFRKTDDNQIYIDYKSLFTPLS